MNKLKPQTYIMRTKWAVIALVVVLLTVFARVVNSPALTKTAIVLGIGIDYSEETKEFEVTAQSSIMASSAGENGSETTYVTYTDKGRTISGALDNIARKMGLTVSLAYCEVLFLSQEALKQDHLQLLYPLTGMYALREQSIVVTGDKSPREMLTARIGTTISAPFFLQQALLSQEGTDGMIRTTAKDFLARSLSRSGSTAIPYIRLKKMQDQPMDQQGEQKDNYEYDLSALLVFNHTRSEVVKDELAEILAIYASPSTYGALNYAYPEGETIEFRILDKRVRHKAEGRHITSDIELSVDLLDVQNLSPGAIITAADEIVKRTADMLALELSARLSKLFEISKEWNIDFLGLMAKAYQSVGRDLEEDCLSTLSFTPKVKITVKEAA